MSGSVERVRSAIWNSLHDSLTEEQRAAIDFEGLTFEHAARVAIEAMRSPTLAMCLAGEKAAREIPRTGVVPVETEFAADIFSAMIDEALK